jgi:hypothetical protein
MTKAISLFLLMMTVILGCTTTIPPNRGVESISLSTAQRFHAKLDAIADRSGFDCYLDGFPEWRQGSGLRPSVGPLGQWSFVTSSERDLKGHLTGLRKIVLSIQLVPKGKTASDKWLFEFEGFDAVIAYMSKHEEESIEKFQPRRSTEALIALLRETPDEHSSILDAAITRLMEHYQKETRKTPTAFFLSIDGKDPSLEFLARFSSCRPEVRAGSEFGNEKEDVGIKVGTMSVYWQGTNRVDVGYEYDLLPESIWWSGHCRIEKLDDRCTGTEVTLNKGWRGGRKANKAMDSDKK